jgi:hypothetical protein
MMTGGIAGRIGFDFDNAAAQAPGGKVVDDDLANEETRKLDCVWRKLGALQLAK